MRVRREVLVVLCIGVAFGGAHLAQGQEATSASLPDQFQTGEMASTSKPKKKKAEPSSQTLATASKQNTAPVPKQSPATEELPTQIVTEEKTAEPSPRSASSALSQKPTIVTEQQSPAEDSAMTVAPVEKKPRPKKRPRPAIQPEPASIPAPVPMSLSVAQSMAIRAPLPAYPYDVLHERLGLRASLGAILILAGIGLTELLPSRIQPTAHERFHWKKRTPCRTPCNRWQPVRV